MEDFGGVIVTSSGIRSHVRGFNGKLEIRRYLNFYDPEGHPWYSNFKSQEEAEAAVEMFAREGVVAVVGPKAPWIDNKGRAIPNRDENAVGVYLVKKLEGSKSKIFIRDGYRK